MPASVSLKDYFAAAGSRFTKDDAATIGPQLQEIAEQSEITPRVVVDTARSTNSPLHRFYEWDDAVAGDQYRLIQAGEMMRAIKVRVVVDDRPKVMPAYKLVAKAPAAKTTPKGYNALHQESAFAAKMATAAYDDLMAWRAKYGIYVGAWIEFAGVFRQVLNQIDEFEDAGRPHRLDEQVDQALVALLSWREQFGAVAVSLNALSDDARYMVEAIGEADAVFSVKYPAITT